MVFLWFGRRCRNISKVVRIFSNFTSIEGDFRFHFPGNTLTQDEYRVTVNESGEADLAIVLGTAKPGSWVSDCSLGVFKVIQDPPQQHFFRRFTRTAPRWADVTLTPFPDQMSPSNHARGVPTIFNWHLGISYDEVISLDISSKPESISCIASSVRKLPGHAQRFAFVSEIETRLPQVDVFGRGRKNELKSGKLAGLLPYQFSVAIENTSQPDYFTEKVMDCWLAGTIPIYYGAINLENYFPEESFVRLDTLDFSKFRESLLDGEFSSEEYFRRLGAVKKARQTVVEEYSMHALVKNLIHDQRPRLSSGSKNRRYLHDFDAFSHYFRESAASILRY